MVSAQGFPGVTNTFTVQGHKKALRRDLSFPRTGRTDPRDMSSANSLSISLSNSPAAADPARDVLMLPHARKSHKPALSREAGDL